MLIYAESRYPAPRPRRARSGAFIATVEGQAKHAGAACYPVGSGEVLDPARATTPQFLEVGRLLARLHQLGEAHPASVPAFLTCGDLAGLRFDARPRTLRGPSVRGRGTRGPRHPSSRKNPGTTCRPRETDPAAAGR